MSQNRFVGFTNCLQDDDYGIILSGDGQVKGIWMPEHLENVPVPAAIVEICITNFGIDPNKDQHMSQTVH